MSLFPCSAAAETNTSRIAAIIKAQLPGCSIVGLKLMSGGIITGEMNVLTKIDNAKNSVLGKKIPHNPTFYSVSFSLRSDAQQHSLLCDAAWDDYSSRWSVPVNDRNCIIRVGKYRVYQKNIATSLSAACKTSRTSEVRRPPVAATAK
jgi:hypothetical protein